MCAQYSINTPLEAIISYYEAMPFEGEPFQSALRVFPKQTLPVVVMIGGEKKIVLSHWGLRPAWMEKLGKSKELINVRADSLLLKPTMKKFLTHRCLVPATGFYEWKTEANGKKSLYTFEKKGAEIFSMAGVLQVNAVNKVEKFAIITTEPNKYVKPIHNRMPYILTREEESLWLGPDELKIGEMLHAQNLSVLNNKEVLKS